MGREPLLWAFGVLLMRGRQSIDCITLRWFVQKVLYGGRRKQLKCKAVGKIDTNTGYRRLPSEKAQIREVRPAPAKPLFRKKVLLKPTTHLAVLPEFRMGALAT